MSSLYLIKVSGKDHTGITANLMKCMQEHHAELLDIGQSITHGLLTLSFLINTEDENLLKELLFTAKKLNVSLDYEKVESHKHIQVKGDKYILSCVCLDGIKPEFLSEIAFALSNHNINIQRIDRTSHGLKSLDIYTRAQSEEVPWPEVKAELLKISTGHETDMALLKDNVWRRNKRLIVFDMDSTLIQSEVIVEMAKIHGVGDKVHDITERAMNGELDFDQSLIERVKLLKGLEVKKLDSLAKDLKYTNGVPEFITTVKKLGYKIALISGGFSFFANSFKEDLGIKYVFANNLEIKEGKLTGKVIGQIVNAEKKAMLLEMIAQQEEINLEQVVAIGDGANDLEMLAKAGLGIAFHAKEIVKKNAQQHMSHGPMTSILYFLGLSEVA